MESEKIQVNTSSQQKLTNKQIPYNPNDFCHTPTKSDELLF